MDHVYECNKITYFPKKKREGGVQNTIMCYYKNTFTRKSQIYSRFWTPKDLVFFFPILFLFGPLIGYVYKENKMFNFAAYRWPVCNIHRVRQAGAGMVWEKNIVGLAGAGAGGWSGVRGNYYSTGGYKISRTQWFSLFERSLNPHRTLPFFLLCT